MNSLIEPEISNRVANHHNSDLVLQLEGVSVRYRIPNERIVTLKEFVIRFLQRRLYLQDFWALQKINLKIYHGEIFGIIGRNGAGKSTLLKVISRVLTPTDGRIRIKSRVSPLLELGAGFHPELTGRENIFLNATLLGYRRRDIESKMSEILDFAEIGSFIDAPLRTYSSGMVARLGFAVATAWEPEILILDEVLSVGDEAFKQKCKMRMENYQTRGTTILLVTHDMETVTSICTRAAWLENGTLKVIGEVGDVIKAYQASNIIKENR